MTRKSARAQRARVTSAGIGPCSAEEVLGRVTCGGRPVEQHTEASMASTQRMTVTLSAELEA